MEEPILKFYINNNKDCNRLNESNKCLVGCLKYTNKISKSINI